MNWTLKTENNGFTGGITASGKSGRFGVVFVWDFVYWDNILGAFFSPNPDKGACDLCFGLSAIQLRVRLPWFKTIAK